MCPALILAANRTERVIGRTRVLTVSIRIRKGFSQAGAPPGRRAARVERGLNITDEIISLNHKGRPKAKVKTKWDEVLNTYGATPIKLIVMIKINKGTKIEVRPFKWVVLVRLDCWAITSIGSDNIQKVEFGEIQKIGASSRIVTPFINQKREGDILNIDEVAGSKEEKMSNIIKPWLIRAIYCFEGN